MPVLMRGRKALPPGRRDRYRARMRYAFLLAAFILGMTGWTGWWYYASTRAAQSLVAWIEAKRGEGWTIEHGRVIRSGFPFRIVLSVAEPAIEKNELRWSAGLAQGAFKPWDFSHVIVSVEGAQEGFAPIQGERRRYTLETSRALASARFDAAGRALRADAEFLDVALAFEGMEGAIKAARLDIHLREAGTGIDLALAINKADVAAFGPTPLGPAIAEAALQGRIGEAARLADGMEAWRQAGGTLDITTLRLLWGPLDLAANGTVAFDSQRRPIGAGKAKARGYEETIDAAKSLIRSSEARLLKIALGALAKRDADPRPYVEVPISAQDGRLFIGPAPAARLAPLY
ncbi:MAG: DUF2125 domain-containing protein [Alphaproteobacteria bacterium]|nr:DUF2125 domain-containing protein [Alphaproteobacteria bacterium]